MGNVEAKYNQLLITAIQDALGTAETGNALIEVARNAHMAEMELAAYQGKLAEFELSVAQIVKLVIDMNGVIK